MLWLTALILLLYLRTLNYNYCIDDYVKRDGYLYDIPMEGPSHAFWSMKPSPWYRLFMIGMHCVNTWIIYMLWGWAPALLFAVHPMAVWGTAWVTGNYYATTAFFCLIVYYILTVLSTFFLSLPTVIPPLLVALVIYASALNSTICAVGLPFFLALVSPALGWTFFIPLWLFLRGKRFTTGMKIREKLANKPVLDISFTPRRLVLMTKVMARYIYFFFVPNRLGLFTGWGNNIFRKDIYEELHRVNGEFWSSLALCGVVLTAGLIINPIAILWFFIFMGIHSQWSIRGQFIAQRYLYLPMIGLCVIAGTVLQSYPYALAVIATFLVIRTHLFIPAWRNMESLNRNDMENFPENPHAWSNASQYYITQHDGVFKSNLRFHEVGHWLYRALAIDSKCYQTHVNFAAWYMTVRNYDKCIEHTEKAIESIEFNYDNNAFLPELRKQLDKLKLKKGELGISLSHPTAQGGRDGKRQDESKEAGKGVECNGSSEHQGREKRLTECVS